MPKVRKLYAYRDEMFVVNGESPVTATVCVVCTDHDHDEFAVCLIDGVDENWVRSSSNQYNCDWAVGREGSLYPIEGDFRVAVERASGLLLEECHAMAEIQEFFGDEPDGPTTAKILSYEGSSYAVARNSPVSATVAKMCRDHAHAPYMLGLLDDEAVGWIMGRAEGNTPKYSNHDAGFTEAVKQAANLLLRECLSMGQVDDFFREGVLALED